MTTAAYRRPTVRPSVDLLLDANEGPRADARLLEAFGRVDPDALRRYPDAAALEQRLERRLGLPPGAVLVTAGADDGIDRCCRLALAGGGRLLMPRPGFEMFRRYAALAGGAVTEVDWGDADLPVEAFTAAADEATRAVAVISPNNPTGLVASLDAVRRLARAVAPRLVIVDAAYAEFADVDPTPLAAELENVVVLRSFSKAWGLAGMRVGFVAGPPATIARLRACGPPYAVSGPSLAVAATVLDEGEATMRDHVDRVRRERECLASDLAACGARVTAPGANFVFVRHRQARRIHADLQALGIAVRAWPDVDGLGDALRIGCPGDAADLERLRSALRTVLRPEALLLDMDGVLADEGPSYREAIRLTAASYGIEVTRAQIAARKAAGRANNDWELTCALLRDAGIDAGLDEVVGRFEEFYQGREGEPGLWTRERPLVDGAFLAGLAARLPLAVVTGRPRRDAERFLEQHDLAAHFAALVTLDDAPAKPDPAPVRLALERLGATSAWMVGDTPDDARAARAAGVLPLGLLPPEASDAVDATSLLDAGCARVLERLEDLEDLLP